MAQNVMITGCGRSYALGFNMVKNYLDNGDNVIATVRKESEKLNKLKEKYNGRLIILTMDISRTESVEKAREELEKYTDHIDLLINNAVNVSPDCDMGFFEANLDYIKDTVDVIAVGSMRVIKAFYPLLKNSETTALIINISSEAGSISKCYRTAQIDYGMAKAALNMATMNLYNTFKDDDKINIFAVHPGWIRTDNNPLNPAPLSSYEAADILRKLFETIRFDKTRHRFITNENEDYPF